MLKNNNEIWLKQRAFRRMMRNNTKIENTIENKEVVSHIITNDKRNIVESDNMEHLEEKICFLIPNRGGTHIKEVIENINSVYSEYNKEIVILNQCDDSLFKKGQLYNIGMIETDSEWIALCDNDIIHLNKILLFQTYENAPYLGFTYITQLKITNNQFIKGTKDERRSGAGAFLFGKRSDFVNVNGFSNLYVGWGCEDNEMSCRLCGNNDLSVKLKRIPQELGHITHPRRVVSKIYRDNLNIFKSRRNRNVADDGLEQTKYDLISKRQEDNVTYIDVKNIRVDDNFKYKALIK